MVRGLGSIWKTHSERRKEDFQLEGAEGPSGPSVGILGHLSELWSPGPCPRYGLGEFCFNSFLKGQDAGVSQTHICFSPTASDAGELEGGEGGICRGWEAGPPYSQGISWIAHKPSPLWSLAPCQALLKSHTHELFPGIRTYWEVPAAGWN